MLESLFNKVKDLKDCNFIEKGLQHTTHVLSCEYCEIFKSTYFEEHLRTDASITIAYFSEKTV